LARKPSQLTSAKTLKNNIDNIAGAGGGMLLVSLAQNLPEENPYKSWLIILAPALTLFIKYIWNFLSPEVSSFVKKIKVKRARNQLIAQIDKLLNDSTISEERKNSLREKREQVKLSTVEALSRHLEAIIES
jgi:hypothetical protein